MRKLICAILPIIVLCGCWDKTELNERAYVNSIAIDKATEENAKDAHKESGAKDDDCFFTAVAVSDLKPFDGNDNGGKDDAENKSVKKSTGRTVSSAIRRPEAYSSHKLFLGHAKAVFLGEELLKDKKLLSEALDALERDKELSRKTLVLAVEGNAVDIISAKPAGEPSIGVFTDNFYKTNRSGLTFAMTLEDLFIKLRSGESAVLPKIKEEGEELVIGGGAVLKELSLCGFIDETEMRGFLWQKKIKGESVIVNYGEIPVPFSVNAHSVKTRFYEDGGKPVMLLEIKVSGSIQEYTFGESIGDDELAEIERLIAELIINEADNTNNKLQKEFEADAAGVTDRLRKMNYGLWEKYGESAFEDMDIRIKAEAKVKSVGLLK